MDGSSRKQEETWGLTQHKGDFPHGFNHPLIYHYMSPYPDKEYYRYYQMNFKDPDKLDELYNITEGRIF